ncbi:MAG TPA: OmpH family outer membrane protein [Chitinophagales bacterium]|nr:OmpH family outer membrane protein [Chitinophagales bacterium]
MKKSVTTICILIAWIAAAWAQRFVFVDTEYILSNIPEYKQAQKKLDEISEGWRTEIDRRYKEIDDLYKAFQAEQILMPEDVRLQKQQEIEKKEKEVKDYQKQKFGYEGELFQKKQELIKPIQDKIYNEIQKMASEKAYDFVFDKSGGVSMLYASSKYDKSDDILRAMGYVPSAGKQSGTKE